MSKVGCNETDLLKAETEALEADLLRFRVRFEAIKARQANLTLDTNLVLGVVNDLKSVRRGAMQFRADPVQYIGRIYNDNGDISRKGCEPKDQWWEVSKDIFEQFCCDDANISVLCVQPQQGKTGMATCTIYRFIKACEAEQAPFIVYYVSALDHTTVRDQSKKTIIGRDPKEQTVIDSDPDLNVERNDEGAQLQEMARQTGFNRGFYVQNRSGARNEIARLEREGLGLEGVVRVLIVVDECHLANLEEGDLRVVYDYFGVDVHVHPRLWSSRKANRDVKVVLISATPYAHLLAKSDTPTSTHGLYTIITAAPNDRYNSFRRMLNNRRIKQTGKLFHESGKLKGKPTSLGYEVFALCDRPGYLPIRVNNPIQYGLLLKFIKSTRGRIHPVEYNCAEDNLDLLQEDLKKQPDRATIIIIKQAMRAGMVVCGTHILAWVDESSKSADANVQSAARACGYGKFHETYPVYCNVKDVAEYAGMYDRLLDRSYRGEIIVSRGTKNARHAMNVAPSGSSSPTVRLVRRITGVFTHEQAESAWAEEAQTGAKRQGKFAYIGGSDEHGIPNGRKNRDTMRAILNDDLASSGNVRWVMISAKGDILHPDSYAQMLDEHPEWRGMALRIDTIRIEGSEAEAREYDARMSAIKLGSATRPRDEESTRGPHPLQ